MGAALTIATLWSLGVAWLWERSVFARRTRARISVEHGELAVENIATGHTRRLSCRKLERPDVGVVEPPKTTVMLHRGWRRALHLETSSVADAERLVRLVGLHPQQRPLRFEGASLSSQTYLHGWGAMLAWFLGTAFLAGLGAPSEVLGAGFGAAVVCLVAPSKIEVARDGVMLRWLGYRRFVPHREIANVRVVERAEWTNLPHLVVLERRDGTQMKLPCARGVADKLAGAVRAGAFEPDGCAPPIALARGEREPAAWARALRQLDGGLRAPAVERAVLWRVAESPGACTADRAAALVALGDPCTVEECERRASLEACSVDPALHAVLTLPEATDDDARGRALARVEARAATRR